MMHSIGRTAQLILATLVSSTLIGCSMAPLSNSISARTNGPGRWNVDGGIMASGEDYYARAGYGVSENNDLGLVTETTALGSNYGAWHKYAFLNQDQDFSVALDTGLGSGDGIDYYALYLFSMLKLESILKASNCLRLQLKISNKGRSIHKYVSTCLEFLTVRSDS